METFSALALRDLLLMEYAQEFCGIVASMALDDATMNSLFWIGANYDRPVDLPDTTGLSWREGILRCLESVRPRSRTSPPSSPSAIIKPQSSLSAAADSSPPPSAAPLLSLPPSTALLLSLPFTAHSSPPSTGKPNPPSAGKPSPPSAAHSSPLVSAPACDSELMNMALPPGVLSSCLSSAMAARAP
ncbi:mucin-7-like [Onychostoma macrolepis]|uniref:mucin-7-like n=1 Tax=Onychostoma macrolepis TaxID=369639 RepID=UPI00272AC35D|nr:mucin-7-like [Onychostoma macrolepis]